MKRPLIGITLDSEEPGGYSKFPWYALRQNYCESVVAAGGVPFPLPHEPSLAAEYLSLIDGLIVTGGAFDVDPALFGAATRHETVKLKTKRTEFELAMVQGAYQADMPILGICGGEQLLNVALGGTLIQHIPDEVPNSDIKHEQPNPRNEPGHSVKVVSGTLLERITNQREFLVNSAHHQAVLAVAPSCVANAHSPDGIIEGIEDPSKKFCMGVQWHPEFFITSADRALYSAFLKAAL